MTDREHDQLLATATDRFERRLSEEAATLRAGDAAIRLEIASLRVDMSEQNAATRREVAKDIADLRIEMSDRFAESRVHTEARHRELLKWAIVFWVGQAAAVAGIVSAFA